MRFSGAAAAMLESLATPRVTSYSFLFQHGDCEISDTFLLVSHRLHHLACVLAHEASIHA